MKDFSYSLSRGNAQKVQWLYRVAYVPIDILLCSSLDLIFSIERTLSESWTLSLLSTRTLPTQGIFPIWLARFLVETFFLSILFSFPFTCCAPKSFVFRLSVCIVCLSLFASSQDEREKQLFYRGGGGEHFAKARVHLIIVNTMHFISNNKHNVVDVSTYMAGKLDVVDICKLWHDDEALSLVCERFQ